MSFQKILHHVDRLAVMKSFLGKSAITRERSLRREVKIYFRGVFCQRKKLLHYLKAVFLVFFMIWV